MSKLIAHANRELDRIGLPPSDPTNPLKERNRWEPDRQARLDIMELVTTFAAQNHSGFSASYVLHLATKLMDFKPLGPLTNDPEEWDHISEQRSGRSNLWQNTRDSRAFSEDGGKTYYFVDEYRKLAKRLWFLMPRLLRTKMFNRGISRTFIHPIYKTEEAQ